MDLNQSLRLVYDALRRVNETRSLDDQVPEEPDVMIVGEPGLLDSLALTTLILTIEDAVSEKIGKDVSLIQEAQFDTLTKQFRTPRAIAELIARNF